jgi:hypothetical protein
VPKHAERVIEDPAIGALTAALAQAEALGHDPERLLRQAADQRALDDARSPARTLAWRMKRLSARLAPSPRAHAAQARSAAAQHTGATVQTGTVTPASQLPQARRR